MADEKILGQFPSDHFFHVGDPALDADPLGVKDVRGDGNIALHSRADGEHSLFDHTNVGTNQLENLLGFGEGHKVTRVEKALGDVSLSLSLDQREADARDEAMGTEWLRLHDPSMRR